MKKTIKSFSIGAFLASTIAFSPIASADTADGASLMSKSWNEIVETAKGGEVNWFLWGGADHINQYVTEYVGGVLKDKYNITLNRVPLTDTAAAVNTVLSEKESGVTLRTPIMRGRLRSSVRAPQAMVLTISASTSGTGL